MSVMWAVGSEDFPDEIYSVTATEEGARREAEIIATQYPDIPLAVWRMERVAL